MPKLSQTIPALPVRKMAAAVAFYRDRLGFDVLHHNEGFAVVARDAAVVHLWESGDETWRERPDFAKRPVCTGAETFMFIFAISYAQAISAFVNDGDDALRTEVERWEPEAREAVGSSTRRGRLSVLTSA